MTSKSKDQILKLVNKQVARVYRASIISGILLAVSLVIDLIVFNSFRGIVIMLISLLVILNFLRIKSSCKEEIGFIFINNKDVCRKLNFFKVIEEDVKIDCMLGVIRIDGCYKKRLYSNNR